MTETLHIYTRVSSIVQEEQGTSLETQKEMGVAKAFELGIEYKIWNEGGKSSKHEDLENRPVLRDLLLGVEDGTVNNLFVYNTDRLSRNQRTWASIRWKLKERKVKLHTPSGVIDLSSPMDELIFGILSEISQYDNALRSQRSQIGKLRKVKSGFWMGGPPPFGYRLKDGMLIIDQDESTWVRRMFERSAAGTPTMKIKVELEANDVLTRRKSTIWSLASIQKILHNTMYLGHHTYTDKKLEETVQCTSPAIVDQRSWDDVIKQREHVLERKCQNNRTKKFYMLRNLMYCGHCGRPMSGKKNPTKREFLYYCPNKERSWLNGPLKDDEKWVHGNGCGLGRSLNIPRADDIVFRAVHETLNDTVMLHDEMKAKLDVEGNIKSRKRLEKQRNALLREELDRIEIALCDVETDFRLDKIEPSIHERLMNKLTITRTNSQATIEQSSHRLSEVNHTDQRLNELLNMTVAKAGDSDTDKRSWLEQYIRRIDVRYDQDTKHHDLTTELFVPLSNGQIIGTNSVKSGQKSLSAPVGTTPR